MSDGVLDLFASADAPPRERVPETIALDRRGSSREPADVPTPEELRRAGVLRDVDVHFARAVARRGGVVEPLVLLGLAVASRAPGAGHVCAELAAPERLVRLERGAVRVRWPDPGAWRDALSRSHVVAPVSDAADTARPLVLDDDRLYLARYWRYQRRLLDALRARAGVLRTDVDTARLRDDLVRLFGEPAAGAVDLQRVAAAAAVLRGLAVITGGPGTGKTTTVLRVLALLVEQARAAGSRPPRVALAAPTGKAAARLAEAVREGIDRLALPPDVAAHVRGDATTVHRLLGWQPRTPTRFRHHAGDPLPADVVVVDEVSMVDLALMAKLVDAVHPRARLVLLGDRDQLASVEAGSILADVCGTADNRFGHAFAQRLADACGDAAIAREHAARDAAPAIADCVVRLRVSHRFRDDGGVGALARAINDGDAERALAVLASGDGGEVSFVPLESERAGAAHVRSLALPGYRLAVRSASPKAALDALDGLRVLAAHREGALGVAGLNAMLVHALAREGSLPADAPSSPWYHGMPLIVGENDHQQELYNGDVGVVLRDGGGQLRAWFRAPGERGVRGVSPARLPAHETVFAMTVHKAQGSEFDRVVLVLPERPSPVLTRELLYTAVSRARRHVTVVGSEEVLRAAVAERVQRASGLREALWAG